ncbi:MAG: hypothetical protein IJW64_01175 [Clostridia bacterium]|nr:hypothetical protein [Clostridia bacterium]
MKIAVTNENKTFKFFVPAKLTLKLIMKFKRKKNKKMKQVINSFLNDAFKILKEYKKKNGSFTLLEFEDSETKTTITF